MSQNETTVQRIYSVMTFAIVSIALAACSPTVPQEETNTKNNNSLGNGPTAVNPLAPGSNQTPIIPSNPAPTDPTVPTTPPTGSGSTASKCGSVAKASWMVQDVSYSVVADAQLKRSYLCSAALPETAVGSAINVQSSNGTAGTFTLECKLQNGIGAWVGSAAYCGEYTAGYVPEKSTNNVLKFATFDADAANKLYGTYPVYRNFNPYWSDLAHNLDRAEGPSAGYKVEGVAFDVVHLAATQDRGTLTSTVPTGLKKIYRCLSTSRGRHYVNDLPCKEAASDQNEGVLGYLFTSSTSPAIGLTTTIAVYRCKSSNLDFATTVPAECSKAGGATSLLGYAPRVTTPVSRPIENVQRMIASSAVDALPGWEAGRLNDLDVNTFYSSAASGSELNDGSTVRAQSISLYMDGYKRVNRLRMRARMANGKALAFPQSYQVYVTDETNSIWVNQGAFNAQPDANGDVVISLPAERLTLGVHIVPIKFGVDDAGTRLFQLGEAHLSQYAP